ncbi:MAG: hypothetical protein A3B23_00860 [Candidatus Colwellbacteria bacterium RIFCSPLOWO2_01_FULL_48_10]|uniref:DUF202 domain-containing protein n=2 Tax=Bacteria candidate phyla TaxID=1783234 RepID=A0A1F5P440_9BACT|nr:MAG: hypothetical protein A2846_04110 [Candidatus Doudnabacteria bacterium RIFCSPHIGHO2_01_FULL_49_9]OGY59496.1 MAG: hypothetical protein A3B23_00860 [Candidatus Colwellbacteria bacterium RIFCSPLOWO2_01_FULL_48_10]
MNSSHKEIPPHKLILRDHLAVERTMLANERTLLAYIRTSLALVITGVSGVHFFDNHTFRILGSVLIAGGLIALVIGFARFYAVREATKEKN